MHWFMDGVRQASKSDVATFGAVRQVRAVTWVQVLKAVRNCIVSMSDKSRGAMGGDGIVLIIGLVGPSFGIGGNRNGGNRNDKGWTWWSSNLDLRPPCGLFFLGNTSEGSTWRLVTLVW